MTDPAPPRTLPRSLLAIVGMIVAGLMLRLVPMGLPGAVVKHGGSVLWAMMIHAIVIMIRPHWSPGRSGTVATIIACGIELSQLYHRAALDAVRANWLGALLFGRVFSIVDLVVYALAITIGALVEHMLRRRT
ncbi:ribosomal maturation YjgA family protein [Sphingomonas sp. CFBP 8760]|uniref:ribosomal maturation YjgA family protein n=1 Tax=Sphingomonas sp. CFBP 8760 TaxID=2775282 RepID=UPI0017830C8F|nr:DUF2809 domain-containing protein [Sphingomonas sp. CFBP 8760]MBD8547874.1 DUF2809 domain-containing protein [Sphingomonas sp. CFBP 8760]